MSPKRFEYQVLEGTLDTGPDENGFRSGPDEVSTRELNSQGIDGWEVVSVYWVDGLMMRVLMKREMPL